MSAILSWGRERSCLQTVAGQGLMIVSHVCIAGIELVSTYYWMKLSLYLSPGVRFAVRFNQVAL